MGCNFFDTGYNPSIWMYVWMGIRVVALIALVLVGYKLLAKHSPSKSFSSPINVLKERYAKGEISEEEYHNKLEKLKN